MALMRDQIQSLIVEAIEKFAEDNLEIQPEIEIPAVKEHGHYATTVAMTLAKKLRRNPRNIAEDIVNFINEKQCDFIEKIEIAGPGFINFFIKPEAFSSTLVHVLAEGEHYGSSDIGRGKYVQVEFVSANPTGPLHIGHGRGAAVGDSLARILRFCGYKTQKEYYINDAGKQMEILGSSVYIRYLQQLGEEVDFPDDHYKGDYIIELAQEIIQQKQDSLKNIPRDEAIAFCCEYACKQILDGIKKDLQDFGVEFDQWFSEKSLHETGEVKKSIEFLKQRGHIYEKDGALWFKSSSFGDEKDRVVVRSNGETTYFAADIAYHWNKLKRGFNTVIDIWGADHHGYVARMKAAVQALGYDQSSLQVILVQLVNLLRGGQPVAMSTRAGKFVTLREVVEEVGSDAARYIFLTRRSDSHLDFDLEIAKEQSSNNPVYYVQYAHARLCSIFEVAQKKGIDFNKEKAPNLSLLKEEREIKIIQLINEFPYVVQASALHLEPHRIPYYLHNLVSEFHSYYNHHRIICDDAELTMARLYLAEATRIVIRNALKLIGVSAPEKM